MFLLQSKPSDEGKLSFTLELELGAEAGGLLCTCYPTKERITENPLHPTFQSLKFTIDLPTTPPTEGKSMPKYS